MTLIWDGVKGSNTIRFRRERGDLRMYSSSSLFHLAINFYLNVIAFI